MLNPDELDFARGSGAVTVVTVDARTGRALMIAQADRAAVDRTLATGEMHYRSRTRGLWHKGATSGNTQRVVSLTADCDRDAILARVMPAGPACHTGSESCFDRAVAGACDALDGLVAERMQMSPATGYTGRLLADENLRLKKLGEEATELALACSSGASQRVVSEAADLVYHALVAVRAAGASWADVQRELYRRQVAAGQPLGGPRAVLVHDGDHDQHERRQPDAVQQGRVRHPVGHVEQDPLDGENPERHREDGEQPVA